MTKQYLFNTFVLSATLAIVAISSSASAEQNPRPRPLRAEPQALLKMNDRQNNASGTIGTSTRKLPPRMEDKKDLRKEHASSTASSTPKIVDATCGKAASDVRKTSLTTSYDLFSTAAKDALIAREDLIKSAFDKTTLRDRQQARNTARETYKKSMKKAFETLRTSERTALKAYTSAIKACGGNESESAVSTATEGSVASQ